MIPGSPLPPDSLEQPVPDPPRGSVADSPGTTRAVPTATYRIQLHEGHGFDEAAAAVPGLAALGISHLYLSPVLQAVPGSMHGYDVLDHTRLSADLGGAPAFDRLVARAHEHGLGIVVDVVPNHMARPTPETGNGPFAAVLREGRDSPFASWFDIDWVAGDGRILLPVLGAPLHDVLADGQITVDGDLVHYYDHAFPLRPGTGSLPLPELLDAQHYRLAWWTTAADELNYRRFFDVDSLAAIRVEEQAVFDATHAVLVEGYRSGQIDGFRIDHPDGLFDPADYLEKLAKATGGAWVVAEKILEQGERLPADWACTGTTGYDALNLVQALFVDPAGRDLLLRGWAELSGDDRSADEVVEESKRQVAISSLDAEVERLTRIAVAESAARRADLAAPRLKSAIVELLLGMEVYRGYAGTGQGARVITEAEQRARRREPGLAVELAFVRDLAITEGAGVGVRQREFTARFGQTAGPVMAKGIEDTAFYRWYPLSSLTEVGGDAARFGLSADEFHAWCAGMAVTNPAGMTTLSTHDTKRSEDTRARLDVLAEAAAAWTDVVAAVRAASAAYRPARLDGATESLIWQTVYAVSPWAGAGAVAADRLQGYLEKAVREAKVHTSWTAPDAEYESAVHGFAESVLGDSTVLELLSGFADAVAPAVRAVTLGQKLVQLTIPGIPDVYQGCEIVSRTLVDPDNRSDVDHVAISGRLADLDRDGPGADGDLDEEKLLVVSRTLRLRRQHPELFAGSYAPLATGTPDAVAYLRGGRVAVVVSRYLGRPGAQSTTGGPVVPGPRVALPAGTWTDAFTRSGFHSAADGVADGVALSEIFGRLPVALLVREVSV